MDPLTLLALSSAAMKLVKDTLPLVRDSLNNGEVSAADQDKVRAEYESLRSQLGGEFQGEHWELSGR